MLRAALITIACASFSVALIILAIIVIAALDAGTRIRVNEYAHSIYVGVYWVGVWRGSCTIRR